MQFIKEDEDFATTPFKALSEIDKKWKEYPGLIIFGSHSQGKMEEKLEKIREARVNKIPTLGICWGLHLMAIEYARNVLNLEDANTTEVSRGCLDPVVVKMKELRVGIHRADGRMESFWHNYHVNPVYYPKFYKDWTLNTTGEMLDSMRLKAHPHFKGSNFTPSIKVLKKSPTPYSLSF